MTRYPTRNEFEGVIAEAVRRVSQPGAQQVTSGAGRGSVATHEDVATVTDGDGNTIHPFITNIDVTNDLNAVTTP